MPVFDVKLVSADPGDQEVLARQIAEFANADTTGPLSGNNDAWQLDYELRQMSKPVGNTKRWGLYSQICAQAIPMITNNAGRTLLMVEQMNGARRVPDADWDSVKMLLGQIAEQIGAISLEPHRRRLQELLDYHRGIVARYVGDYLRAAVQQELAAKQAEDNGNQVGVVIARLSERVERVNNALSLGEDPFPLLKSLGQRAHELVTVCTDAGDATQLAWKYFSAPAHVLEAYIWSGVLPASEEQHFWLGLFDELHVEDPQRHQKHVPRIAAIEAGLILLQGGRRVARERANQVVTAMFADASPEALSTARMVLAITSVDEHLLAMEEVGAHMWQLRRVAQDVLSGKRSMWPPRIVDGNRKTA